tara:strand:- start:4216 stop:4731 length:516 start_codon:yes stop_codon:yes gene_type:complete
MPLISHIDGETRRIFLSAETFNVSVNPIDIYKEMRTLRATDETLRSYSVFMSAFGNVNKGGGKATERYVVLNSGARIVLFDATGFITVSGTIITDDGQEGIACFNRELLSEGVEVDINYIPPQVEVITINIAGGTSPTVSEIVTGLSPNLTTINNNVKKASLLIPASEDLI